MPDSMIGRTIAHYRILGRLGGGGMGVVYKAQDLHLDRVVALKFLPEGLVDDAAAERRFEQEAKTTSALDHTNICTVYDIDRTEPTSEYPSGQLFIVMRYYEGATLEQVMENGHLAVEDVVDYARQICEGLGQAHQEGIVHRDIKPANLLLTEDGTIKILDFGVAKLLGGRNLTRTGAAMGTLAYMSPEQARGEPLDQRTDLWSLGVVLFQLLTGELPYGDPRDPSAPFKILNEEPRPIASVRPDLPESVTALVDRLLRRNRDERVQNADELRTLVGIPTRLPRPIARTLPPFRSAGLRWTGALAAVVLVVVVLVVWWTRNHVPSAETLYEQGEDRVSIAVLPFENLSDDSEQGLVADGMTSSLVTQLAKVSSFRVISGQSMRGFSDPGTSTAEIARALGVDYLIEVSAAQFQDSIRINVYLVNGPTGEIVWADETIGSTSSVLKLQSSVARRTAEQIGVVLSAEDVTRLVNVPEVDPEAWGLFQQASRRRYEESLLRPEELDSTQGLLERSIRLWEGFAPAHALLSEVHVLRRTLHDVRASEADARAALRRARALAPDDAQVLEALGLLRLALDWDWAGAKEAFIRSVNRDRTRYWARSELAWVYLRLGDFEEAESVFKEAALLDPLNPGSYWVLSAVNLDTGDFDEAIFYANKMLELREGHSWALTCLAWAYHETGREEEARDIWEQQAANGNAQALINLDRIEEVRHVLAEDSSAPALDKALFLSQIGEHDEAFALLERALDEKYLFIVNVGVQFRDSVFRSDPRFLDILERVHLAP